MALRLYDLILGGEGNDLSVEEQEVLVDGIADLSWDREKGRLLRSGGRFDGGWLWT